MVKPEKREEARELRAQGVSVGKIAHVLSVSKSSVSLWVRDIVLTDEQKQELYVSMCTQPKHTEEEIEKMSAALKEKWEDPEYRERAVTGRRNLADRTRRLLVHPITGYKYYNISDKQVKEHRIVAESIIGRPLTSDEVVHHIDRNRQNNHPSNLRVMTQSEHMALHYQQGDLSRR